MMYVNLSTLSPVIPAAASVIYICFAVFGLVQNRKIKSYWSFQIYMLMLAVWSFGSFMMRTGFGYLSPLLWNRVMLIGMLSAPFAMVHAIIDTLQVRHYLLKRISRLSYLLIAVLMYMNFSGMVVVHVSYVDNVFVYRLGSGAYGAYLISYIYLAVMFTLIMVEVRTGGYDQRTRSLFKLYLLGMLIILGGILLNLYKPIGQYPADVLASLINAVILFYGMYRFQLISYTRLGMNVLSKIVLLVLAFMIYFVVILITREFSDTFQPGDAKVLAVIMGGVTLLVLYPLRSGANYLIDHVVIPHRHPYQQRIRELSRKLTTVIDLQVLGDEVISTLTSGVTVHWAACIVQDPDPKIPGGQYILLSQYRVSGQLRPGSPVPLEPDEALERHMTRVCASGTSGSVIVSGNGISEGFRVSSLLPQAHMVIPLMFGRQILGYICISAPPESRIYSQYEKESLEILAGQCALSLKNALSFEVIKTQQQDLQTSNTKLEAIFNGISSPMALTDINFSIIEVNDAAVVYIGKERSEIIGQKCYQLFFSKRRTCKFCKAPDCLRSGHVTEHEVTIADATFSMQFHPVNIFYGSRQVFLEVIQDVSDKRRMADELIHSAKMAKIGSMAAGIAHDLNNPLAGISGTAELMLSTETEGTQRYEYLQDILTYSTSAAEVLKDITTYARKGARQIEPVDIIETLEFSLKLAARGRDISDIELVRDYQSASRILIKSSDLQQVFLNLIMNAQQAMDDRGILKISLQESFGVVQISIADAGCGISKEHINQVFTPFFTTKQPGSGTGLGLSNCYRIVEKYEGRISVDSEVGRGTTVSLFFPAEHGNLRKIRFVLGKQQHHLNDVFFLQRKVLIGEKGYIEETIYREIDDQAIHLLAYQGLQPVGTVSLLMSKDIGKLPLSQHFDVTPHLTNPDSCAEIIRLAVLPEKRHTIATLGLVTLIFLIGRAKGMREVVIDVFSEDLEYIAMYKKFGFSVIGTYSSPSPVTVMIQRDLTPQETEKDKVMRFTGPLFRDLLASLDVDDERELIIQEMRRIIPGLELGEENRSSS